MTYNNKRSKKRSPFITREQRNRLEVNYCDCNVADLAIEINRIIDENDTRHIHASWINDWLISIGMITVDPSGNKVATEAGVLIGITTKFKKSGSNRYSVNYFSPYAQNFVFDHLKDIICYFYNH